MITTYLVVMIALMGIRMYRNEASNKEILFIPVLWPVILIGLILEFIVDALDITNRLDSLYYKFKVPTSLDSWMTKVRTLLHKGS